MLMLEFYYLFWYFISAVLATYMEQEVNLSWRGMPKSFSVPSAYLTDPILKSESVISDRDNSIAEFKN